MKMTPRQSWAIFCITRIDVRGTDLGVEQASTLLDGLNGSKRDEVLATLAAIPGAVKKGEAAKPKQDWKALYDKAHAAGMTAGEAAIPTPMIVSQHANPLDDKSKVTKQWFVGEGACGFAWITIRPANCSFALWLKKNNFARVAYGGGMQIWVSYFNQSVARKEAYADAFAKVLTEAGIKAYAGSRLD